MNNDLTSFVNQQTLGGEHMRSILVLITALCAVLMLIAAPEVVFVVAALVLVGRWLLAPSGPVRKGVRR
jgi:hypothetical protein